MEILTLAGVFKSKISNILQKKCHSAFHKAKIFMKLFSSSVSTVVVLCMNKDETCIWYFNLATKGECSLNQNAVSENTQDATSKWKKLDSFLS